MLQSFQKRNRILEAKLGYMEIHWMLSTIFSQGEREFLHMSVPLIHPTCCPEITFLDDSMSKLASKVSDLVNLQVVSYELTTNLLMLKFPRFLG